MSDAYNTIAQTVPAGGGSAKFEILSDKHGPLAVSQFLNVPELLDYDFQDKADVKTLAGAGSRAIAATSGKHETTIALTMNALYGRMLNQLCYGENETGKEHILVEDKVGYTVPESVFVDTRIRSVRAVHLGRWDSNVGVKIGGVVSATGSGAGRYTVAGGRYQFSPADRGKAFEITFVSDGVTIRQTGRILAKGSHDVRLYAISTPTVRNDATLLARDPWNPTAAAPAAGRYQASLNGVIVFNAAETPAVGKSVTVTHWTDGQSVTSRINRPEFPAAGFHFYVDPPAAAAFAGHVDVTLLADTGAAMTGVEVGGALTQDATPTSGQYAQDNKGKYTFAAADDGDRVRIAYSMDYYWVRPVARNARGEAIEAEFHKAWGVRNGVGKPLVRVLWAQPLAIAGGQYAVDPSGAFYFSGDDAGAVFYIDAEFETEGGSRFEVTQSPVGAMPVVSIALSSNETVQRVLLTFERATCEGMGVKTKTDDNAEAMKFTFKCAVDRVTGRAFAVNTSS